MWSKPAWWSLLTHRSFLWLLVWINALGTVYGYLWYGLQLTRTPWYWIPFVPDSPTASLFFTLFLVLYLVGKPNSWVEAFGAITLVKYGIWAVVMIVWGNALELQATGASWGWDSFHWTEYMLMTSHLAMAIEAVLYFKLYRFTEVHIWGIAFWTLANDGVDYVFGMHPYVSSYLDPYISQVAGVTVGLSAFSVLLIYTLHKVMKPV